MNLFAENVIPEDWDGRLHECTIPGKTDWRELEQPLPCGDSFIEVGFQWNGASVGPLRSLPLLGFPKWKHPIATCRHDKRCGEANRYKKLTKAMYKNLRKIADKMFKADVGIGGTKFEQLRGYLGVRMGSFF